LLILASIFFISLAGSLLAKKMRKPSLIFYILLGLLTSQLLLKDEASRQFVESLSNLGIVLLLFTIGLELPLQHLFRLGKTMLLGSLAQVIVTALILTVPVFLWLENLSLAFTLATALAMSSTAIVGKLLQQKGEDASLSGELTLSILIFQDLVSVALITLLTLSSNQSNQVWPWPNLVWMSTCTNLVWVCKTLLVAAIFFVLTKLINVVFDRFKFNREELALFIFALLFLAVGVFAYFKIPETTAGFLIGVLLAGRREQHEIFSQVRVFRDILLVLFFFFLGTYISEFNLLMFFWAFILALLVMLVKFVVLWLIFVILGLHQKIAFWVSFDLMQVGEFAFVILTIMTAGGLLEPNQSQLLIMVIVCSLLLYSFIYRAKLKYYRWFAHFPKHLAFIGRLSSQAPKFKFNQLALDNHIVLCGYGRVGSYIGHGLILSNLPLVVIDTDVNRIKRLISHGVRAIYGDATEPEILDYAQVERAKFLIVSVPSSIEQEQIILEAKRLNPKIQILTRTHSNQNLRHFKALGVSQVIQPEFEAAITLLKKILKLYDFEKTEIKKRLQYLKMEHGGQT